MFPDFVNASVITQNMQDFTPPHITVVWKAIPGCVESIIEGDLLLSVEDTQLWYGLHMKPNPDSTVAWLLEIERRYT